MVLTMITLKRIPLTVLWCLMVMTTASWGIEVGEPLPDFALRTFEGGTASRETLEGKPLLVIFWNTWCPNCLRELPEIARQSERLGPRGLRVLAVNTAMNDTEPKARAYWNKYGYAFPSGFDHDFDVGQAFGVFGVPTVFLVDSKGVVRYKQSRLPEDMEERFRQISGNE